MARIFKVTIFLTLFLHSLHCDQTLGLPQDEPDNVENMEEPTQAKKQNLVTIDLSECTCTGISTCELTILKSPLMDITCGDGESLCCPMTQSTDSSPTSSVDININKEEPVVEVAPKSNVRVYTITPSIWKDLNPSSPSKKSQKSKGKCVCKARSSCPHKYIDYGFGYHCTYSTVRCCIPEDEDNGETSAISTSVESHNVEQQPAPSLNGTEIETELAEQLEVTATDDMDINDTDTNINSTFVDEFPMTTLMVDEEELQVSNQSIDPVEYIQNETMGITMNNETSTDINDEPPPHQQQNGQGELIITEVTNWNDDVEVEDEYQKEADCYCIPIQKCRMEGGNDFNNMIERRRDTFCPGDLIQCCGSNVIEEIARKRDDVAGEYDVKLDVPDSAEAQQVNQFTSQSEISSTNNETGIDTMSAPLPPQEVVNSAVLTPPFEGYQPPGFYKGYGYQNPQPMKSYPSQSQIPISQNYEQQQPSPYVPNGGQNVSPWMYSKYPPQQVRNGQQYETVGYPARDPYAGETSRHKPGGLFDSLVNLWG